MPDLDFKNLGYMVKGIGVDAVIDTSGQVEEMYDGSVPADLIGEKKYSTLRKMTYNSTIASTLFLQRCLLMAASWRVKPADGDTEDSEIVEFFRTIMQDMSQSWYAFLNKVTTFLLYGWSAAEIILKRREPNNSKFPDGKIGIDNLKVLPHKQFLKWETDKRGELTGMWQQGNEYTQFKDVFIPIEKLLIFNAFADDDSPEGRSLFLGAYEDWVTYNVSQNSIRTAMIRNLVGIPVIRIPGKIFEDAQRPETPEGKAAVKLIEEYRYMGQKINKNNISSFILPSDGFRDNGVMNSTKQYDVSLLSLNGQSLININDTQQNLRANMARVVISDFLQLGTGGSSGGYNLGNVRYEIFSRAIDAINKNIADTVFNNKLIPMVARFNRLYTDKLPTFVPESVAPASIKTIVDSLSQLQMGGAEVFPDENALRDIKEKLGIYKEIKRPDGYMPPYEIKKEEFLLNKKQVEEGIQLKRQSGGSSGGEREKQNKQDLSVTGKYPDGNGTVKRTRDMSHKR